MPPQSGTVRLSIIGRHLVHSDVWCLLAQPTAGMVAPSFKKVLIANRGEIAIRIARAAEGLGIESVAVYSPADKFCLHTGAATQAVEIGKTTDALQPYLDPSALIEAAKRAGADCVHPGYGFLSENADFAKRCADAGLTFIGPPPQALSLFGDKVQARKMAQSLGIPTVPGSPTALATAGEAVEVVKKSIGLPAILKASAGGGGRGMRVIHRETEIAEAFDRCSSEAKNAFGDGSVFIEKLVLRPRHIEVQVLADNGNDVIHLYERDCSVQLRHQKVLEIAPAPDLDPALRERLLTNAIHLMKAVGYVNAGTVEFLVSPETGEHFFIECNPRIQVEHTVTEQVTGVDLIESQFLIASGMSLEGMGLKQGMVRTQGFAVQSRVTLAGPGTISAYKEPSGVGVRVDACGYMGYTPSPQFDPLLAKVVCSHPNSFASAISRSLRALSDFHIAGVPTNIPSLCAILQYPEVIEGNARTSLLTDFPELTSNAREQQHPSGVHSFLQQQSGKATVPEDVLVQTQMLPSLEADAGEQAVKCVIGGAIMDVRVKELDYVGIGDALVVVSAMKTETLVQAPVAGVVVRMQHLKVGDTIGADDVVAVIDPRVEQGSAVRKGFAPNETWAPILEDVHRRQNIAASRFASETQDPGVIRQRARGKLTCKERIHELLDASSFREVGSVAGFASYDDSGEMAFTPANMVGGTGKIQKRPVIVCADDFTSRGGHADGAIAAKSVYLDRLSVELQVPSIRLLDGSSGGGSVAAMVPKQKEQGQSNAKESRGAIQAGKPRVSGGGGSYLPGHLGSDLYARQITTVPVVNMLLGSVVGIGAAKAMLGHFSVMVRDISQLFVAGPPVVQHSMKYDISKEDLGGWQVHCCNGSVDNLAETEAEAAHMVRQFLSYLPSSVYEAPVVLPPKADDPLDRQEEELFTIIPRRRTTTFDIRRVINLIADKNSFFEVGSLWGTDQVTGFARFNGHTLGVLASDSRHVNGGALTADGCDKMVRHLDLCDLFHIPILNLIDNPGFAVGLEHEMKGTIRRGGHWMIAFSQISVPIYTVLLRRSFGVAGNNYATPRSAACARVAWPSADVGGIPPEGGIEAAYKRQLAEADDPLKLRDEIMARIESARGPLGPLAKFQVEEIIDPRDTRQRVCEWVEIAYRKVSQPSQLGPRALKFRP